MVTMEDCSAVFRIIVMSFIEIHASKCFLIWKISYLWTHGFFKKTAKTPKKEIEKAENIRKEYFEGKGQ